MYGRLGCRASWTRCHGVRLVKISFFVASSLSSIALICAVRSIFCSVACFCSSSSVCSSSKMGFSNSSVKSLIATSVVDNYRCADGQYHVQLADVVVEQAHAAGARLFADGVGFPRAVNAVARHIDAQPVRPEDVLWIAERDRPSVGPVPRWILQLRCDLELSHRGLAELTRTDAIPFEELPIVRQRQGVRGLADLNSELALVNAQPVADADNVTCEIVRFLDEIDGRAKLLSDLRQRVTGRDSVIRFLRSRRR